MASTTSSGANTGGSGGRQLTNATGGGGEDRRSRPTLYMGLIKKFKARFCARGDQQLKGVDFFEVYAPVVHSLN
ncbi:hypothetical protein THAOC_06069 [Thalassiosira oceanica]|uniref:Reverse transcriptase Ty1/copia-type domain-containing protein n=1 Tax=Thalassiosira oceanica TaxID=159749 RepID=K0T5J2_THAOC|nr:hypothetical protein THAOC_06069 [Thalassiosira oceanica]|eukprot:EJK72404.1 hypothetical protein THAOC_06069 [Thalassiosira oceanica]